MKLFVAYSRNSAKHKKILFMFQPVLEEKFLNINIKSWSSHGPKAKDLRRAAICHLHAVSPQT